MRTKSVRKGTLAALLVVGFATSAAANHPVLVEGEQDFDGDGLIGSDEDLDNATDRVFGTLRAALAAANGAANQNGSVTIVTSGRFCEALLIDGISNPDATPSPGGNVSIQAAPGVEAILDAVCAGDRALTFADSDNNARQGAVGIRVAGDAPTTVAIRNLFIRNWRVGVGVFGNSRVVIENCRIENTRDWGVHVFDTSVVNIAHSHIEGVGFRKGSAPDNAPNPGHGIHYQDASRGLLTHTTVSNGFGIGILNESSAKDAVRATDDVAAFGNGTDVDGKIKDYKLK